MSAISKILDWAGFRTMATWFTSVIQSLWSTERAGFVTGLEESTRNKFDEIQVGLNQTCEVLAPAFAWGNTPYTGAASWDFNENQEYLLGSYIDIDSNGNTSTPTRNADGTYSAVPTGYTRYPAPSLIYDNTSPTAGQHVVYPVWGWKANEGYAFRPTTIVFRHNASVKAGDLDSHKMIAITLSGSASAAETITGLQTTQEVKVGQMGQFETTDNGVTKPWPCIVTAVTEPAQEGDPYTFSLLSVSEASGPVDNLKLYQAV